MATVVNSLNEDQLLCPICLEVFKDPISTSCGHNFCKPCITKHWDKNGLSCPMCKKVFHCRPLLHVNTFISEICSQFRNPTSMKENGEPQAKSECGGVVCDICTGHKQTAVKSCPECLFSYCQNHLQPHLTVPRLQKHQLMEPMENLEDRMCWEHDKPLELFCRTDQACICMVCTVLEHKSHDVVPLKDEYEKQQVALKQNTSENRHMMKERQEKIHNVKQRLELSRSCAQREMNNGTAFFDAALAVVQRGMTQFRNDIVKKQKAMEKHADELISELELEICQLEHRDIIMGQLAHSNDHLHVIQSFKSLEITPNVKDWTQVKFEPALFESTVEKAVANMVQTLTEQKKQLTLQGELKRLQQHAVEITLDHDTASPWLLLSKDGKQVSDRGTKALVPYNPKRFTDFLCVLGKQGFSNGKFYYEVQVKGNANWDVGVVEEAIDKKDKNFLSSENGCWAIMFRGEEKYTASASPRVDLLVKSAPRSVGVFVDYMQGLVSFYDVETAAHLHSFASCTFTGKLYPFFSPGNRVNLKSSSPLIIKPVQNM